MSEGRPKPPLPTVGASARAARTAMPPHPLTLDGSALLHQMFRMRWPAWLALDASRRAAIKEEALGVLGSMEERSRAAARPCSR